jgi:mono/diheme cytochrome c family protein
MGLWRKAVIGVGALAGLTVILVGSVVAYAYLSVNGRMSAPDTPYPEIAASTDPEVIARGRYLVYGPAHCASCHLTFEGHTPKQGVDITELPIAGGYFFDMGPMGSRTAANLTSDPETGIGSRTDREIARTIRTGVQHNGEISLFMRYSAAKLSDEDLVAVVSYLRTVPPMVRAEPAPTLGVFPVLALMFELTPDLSPPPAHVPMGPEPSVERGAYLADHVMLCTACHRPFDMATFQPVGPKGGGGTPEPSHGADSDMEFVPPNLTSDPTGITGKLDEDAFVARLRHGRVYESSIMPWENFALTDEIDLRSVYRYLRTLPPVQNDVGPPYRKIGSWPAEG